MLVDTKLGLAGEVGTELEEEKAEVLVNAIEIMVIDDCRTAHDPGMYLSGSRIASFLGTEDQCLLPGLTHYGNSLSAA